MTASAKDMNQAYPIVESEINFSSSVRPGNVVIKEHKYYVNIRKNTAQTSLGEIVGVELAGIKGYYNKIKMQYWKPSEAIASSIDKAELYSVGSEAVYSSK